MCKERRRNAWRRLSFAYRPGKLEGEAQIWELGVVSLDGFRFWGEAPSVTLGVCISSRTSRGLMEDYARESSVITRIVERSRGWLRGQWFEGDSLQAKINYEAVLKTDSQVRCGGAKRKKRNALIYIK